MYDSLGRLLYLGGDYEPAYKIYNECVYLQTIIRQTLEQIEETSENGYEVMLRKQSLANHMRDKIHIVKD